MAILLVNKCYIFRRKKTEISDPNHCLPMNPLPPIFIHSIRVRILASLFRSVVTDDHSFKQPCLKEWSSVTHPLLKSSFIDDGKPIRQKVHFLDDKWD